MKNTLHNVDALFRLPLFAALGLAIFLGGCTYTYTESSEIGSSNMELREHIAFKWATPAGIKRYTGPQNAQEIMKALDASYNRGRSKIEVSVIRKVAGIKIADYSSKLTMSEIDARYPRTEWLQMLLDRGITIEYFNNYASYLLKRHTLALLEDNPDLWQSEILDIPPTDDWEIYKEAYIDQLVKDHTKSRKSAEQIERSKKEIERAKTQLEHSKEQVALAIERSKKEVERAKAQLEHSKEQIERAQQEVNSQQFEHARKQLEHAMKQIEHIQRTLEHSKEPIPLQEPILPQEPTPPKEPTLPQEPN